jgi:tetratricopeptide (TPR) repeat protein
MQAELKRDESRRWRSMAQVAIIFGAALLVYLPALRAGFVWDDEQLITSNPLLRTFSGLIEIWSGGRTADYFPITNTVFWIEHHLFGDNAIGYHVLNILLQATDAVLAWLVLRRLQIPGAWFAGLIFGIHPVHVESVAWISELKNVLAMFFTLLSILYFLKIGEKPRGRTAYILSLILFALALLSKTQVVFVPVALVLCLWWRDRRSETFRSEAIRTWPFFVMAAVFSLITIWFQNRGIGEEEIIIGSFPRRLVNAGMAIWWYAGKVFVPTRLMAIYPRWRFDSPDLWEWLPLVALVVMTGALWFLRNRGTRGAFFAVGFFVVALLPVIGLVRMAYLRSSTLVADHLQYFADLSLIALVCAGAAMFANRARRELKTAIVVISILSIGVMGVYAWQRTQVFHDEESLWRDSLVKNPDAWQAHARLGQYFFRQEKYSDAIEHLQRAVELKPELPEHHNLLGLAYCRAERFEEGIAEYREALRLKEAKPSTAQTASVATVRANLANALTIVGNNLGSRASEIPAEAMRRYDEAITQYEKALELEPNQPAIHRNLGMLLARLGRYDEAKMHLQRTLQIVPNERAAREALEEIEAQRR